MQHFLELFFCMNSLSTVPSFHVTFFFLGLRVSVRVVVCDGAGGSRVMVVVAVVVVDDDDVVADCLVGLDI
ncbi:hypothetical protein Hanom_Chr05g00405041 [Helianthus anomalus]